MTNLLLLSVDSSVIVVIPLILILVALYLWMCYEVGKYAKMQGRDFWLFFIISFLVNPIIVYIILALFGKTDPARRKQLPREVKDAPEQEPNNQETEE